MIRLLRLSHVETIHGLLTMVHEKGFTLNQLIG